MKFYAASNRYASETSVGFANTWFVLVFNSRTARDEYVQQARDLATRAITRRDVPRYADAHPKPFSGEYIGILDDHQEIPGYVGYVNVVTPHDLHHWEDAPERFYS